MKTNHKNELNFKYRPTNKGIKLTLWVNYVGDNWDVEINERINYGNYTFVDVTEERLLPQKVEPKILRLWLNYSTLIVFEFNRLYVPALDIHETAFLTYAT